MGAEKPRIESDPGFLDHFGVWWVLKSQESKVIQDSWITWVLVSTFGEKKRQTPIMSTIECLG